MKKSFDKVTYNNIMVTSIRYKTSLDKNISNYSQGIYVENKNILDKKENEKIF